LVEMLLQNRDQMASADADLVRSLLESAIQLARTKATDAAATRTFLENIQAWKLMNGKDFKLSQAAREALAHMIGQSRFLYRADGGSSTEFQAMIAQQSRE